MRLSALWHHTLARLPSQCALCNRWQQHLYCARCVAQHATPRARCLGCARHLPAAAFSSLGGSGDFGKALEGAERTVTHCGACVALPAVAPLRALDAVYAAVDYAAPWQAEVLHLKFHQGSGRARALAQLWLQNAALVDALYRCDWLLPVPLSAERLKARGFNQSALLAQGLHGSLKQAFEQRSNSWGNISGVTTSGVAISGVSPSLHHRPVQLARAAYTLPQLASSRSAANLLKILDTPALSTLGAAARWRNAKNAYLVPPQAAAALKGTRIALVDDVMTTGATLASAAAALKRAGAEEVVGVVLARAGLGGR